MADALYAGEQVHVVVPGAFPSALCRQVVACLEGRPRHESCYYPGGSHGQVLLAASDLGAYRRAARELEAALPREALERLTACLRQLNPGRRIGVPRDAEGFYAAFTVRVLEPGGAIALHSERPDWPAMEALGRQVDLSLQLSFYVLLQAPEAGGELMLYDGAEGADEQAPHRPLPLGEGDLVLFDGTRHNHRVDTVRGTRARWTLGGFMARAGEARAFFS